MILKQITLLSLIALMTVFSSCNKDDDTDNRPLIERISGEWNAEEVANGQTTTGFTVTISDVDGEVSINDNRTPPPFYSLEGFTYAVNEEENTFKFGTVNGVVENDSNISINYAFGTAASTTNVSLILTR